MACIFCRIVTGEIPSVKVYEDDTALAIMDINPLTEGHLLVLPKQHVENLFDVDESVAAGLMAVATRLARHLKRELGIEGLNLLQASGALAAQSVPHLHYHLIPRRPRDGAPFDWKLTPGDPEAIRALGDQLAARLDSAGD